jgi:hypothetical protein
MRRIGRCQQRLRDTAIDGASTFPAPSHLPTHPPTPLCLPPLGWGCPCFILHFTHALAHTRAHARTYTRALAHAHAHARTHARKYKECRCAPVGGSGRLEVLCVVPLVIKAVREVQVPPSSACVCMLCRAALRAVCAFTTPPTLGRRYALHYTHARTHTQRHAGARQCVDAYVWQLRSRVAQVGSGRKAPAALVIMCISIHVCYVFHVSYMYM